MNEELIAKTPLGEIAVGIKSDPDYPGVYIELRGDNVTIASKRAVCALHGWSIPRRKSACRPSSTEMAMQTISRISLNTRGLLIPH